MINTNDILNLESSTDAKFREYAGEVYRFQVSHNSIYAKWCDLLGHTDQKTQKTEEFCFLPIGLFKEHHISCYPTHELAFTSSATSGMGQSKHYIHRSEDYINTFTKGFQSFFSGYRFDYMAALLPSYLDREGSGLIYMVNYLIHEVVGAGDFYNRDYERLIADLEVRTQKRQVVALFGVTFGLLELLAFPNKVDWHFVHIIETGGMKGHGKEITRNELYERIRLHFKGVHLHSEYGMTELTSQAYSHDDGLFLTPPWMRVLIQDPSDYQHWLPTGKTGRICIIDLMNYHSCAFIATDDLGRLHPDGRFEILGRLDYADIRGCNQLL